LSYVASLHAKDLFVNHPDQGACNVHSWSAKGSWSPFCYPKDETKKNSVWDKPRELTRYPSRAYEIVYWENNPLIADTIMMVWETESYYNGFLLNSGKWAEKKWNAIGIAIFENYACAWFGEVNDPEGDVLVCGTKTEKKSKDTTGTVIKPNVDKNIQPAKASLPKDSIPGTYYIIVKTNLSLKAANTLVNSLKTDQYPDAKVLVKDDKIRVSVFESADKATAMTKLKEVKKTYKDAWLFKK
jgi:hypothetical protein